MTGSTKTQRRVCFVTGTRAEFGLMRTVLRAIGAHRRLRLQLIATGMHLDPEHGDGLAAIRNEGFTVDAVVPWAPESSRSPVVNAGSTGRAIADLAEALDRLKSNIVLVVGDRVEAFAAAAAGHLSHRVVAHVHGGDRALGQIDDSLRHAITKLAHVHFPATEQSACRIERLGEDRWRIHRVGSPGNDAIVQSAAPWADLRAAVAGLRRRDYAMLVLHPTKPNAAHEHRRAQLVLDAIRDVGLKRVLIVYPNNDPGSAGIINCWQQHSDDPGIAVCRDLPRGIYLGLLRHAAMLVGNSSSGIIEAASFGTPVLDIGPRQAGRERGPNVTHCDYDHAMIIRSLRRVLRGERRMDPCDNVYGGRGTGRRIANALAKLKIDPRLITKLIRY